MLFLLLMAPSFVHAIEEAYEVIPAFMYEEQNSSREDSLIEVHDVSYIRNKKASFCTRPTDMIDTIVIHHSETRNTETPQDINQYHLNRGTKADPWYMIAYSFVINAPYAEATTPESKVYVGRPIDIVGAHAGSNIFVPMDEVQSRLWAENKVLCRTETGKPTFNSSLVKNGKIKANVTTIGIVVIGNYSEFSGEYIKVRGKVKKNPMPNLNGFSPTKRPTSNLIDMYARISCQLQKQYTRIKTLAYHNQYHETSCPGSIQEAENMKAIQTKAKEYGCEFKFLEKKYY